MILTCKSETHLFHVSRKFWIKEIFYFSLYEGKVKSSRSCLRQTGDKRPWGKDPDKSWCHCYTNIKLFWLQRTDPWTERQHNHMMPPISMGCDQESFTLVWQWHQPYLGSYPTTAWPEFQVSCRLGYKCIVQLLIIVLRIYLWSMNLHCILTTQYHELMFKNN